jgi:nucleotide-binding universal stress UspA family protein
MHEGGNKMFSLSKILVPVAFSDQCRAAVSQAAVLACRFTSELTLLHVCEPVRYIVGVGEAGLATTGWSQNQLQEIREHMDTFFALDLGDVPAQKLVVPGDPATEIVRLAHNEKVDLIVMPTHGYGTFRRLLLGSVTAKVLHDATCPLWTGVHMEEPGMLAVPICRRIACAIDLGPQTRATLSWAAGLAEAWAASLTIVHVSPSIDAANGVRDQILDLARQEVRAHQEALGVAAEVHIEFGHVPDAICSHVGRMAADLLVIGRGHGSAAGGRLPTAAYAIIRDSPCAVVSV